MWWKKAVFTSNGVKSVLLSKTVTDFAPRISANFAAARPEAPIPTTLKRHIAKARSEVIHLKINVFAY